MIGSRDSTSTTSRYENLSFVHPHSRSSLQAHRGRKNRLFSIIVHSKIKSLFQYFKYSTVSYFDLLPKIHKLRVSTSYPDPNTSEPSTSQPTPLFWTQKTPILTRSTCSEDVSDLRTLRLNLESSRLANPGKSPVSYPEQTPLLHRGIDPMRYY